MVWINAIIQGALLGGLYALFAAGLSLMFGVMRFVNLAHGDFIVTAAYLMLALVSALHVHPAVAIVFVLLALGTAGYLNQRILLNRVLGSDLLPPVLVTFGLSIISWVTRREREADFGDAFDARPVYRVGERYKELDEHWLLLDFTTADRTADRARASRRKRNG